jgi:hypothetical protein
MAGPGQALVKSGNQVASAVSGRGIDKSDHRHCRLLRSCRHWPRLRAAEQRDELAPSHSITSSVAQQRFDMAHVRNAITTLTLGFPLASVSSCTWTRITTLRFSARAPTGAA